MLNAMDRTNGWELIDAGDGRRLERFGGRIVDRPAPTATERRRAPASTWSDADLVYDRDRGWHGADLEAWAVDLDGLRLELRPTEAGQVGLYPEHRAHWPWLRDHLAGRSAPAVLHLFAATGASTLALASAGARVTHVDASRPAVAWARRNAELSGLAAAPIRWMVDDALDFVRREGRRRRRYTGIVLDPPSYGHGPGGRRWALVEALPELLDAIANVAESEAFVLLTAHSTGLTTEDLAAALDTALGRARHLEAEPVSLVATSGAVLPLGVAARMIR
jgi:23S rRNA (cytosine1962-C5)-methyltransferase